MAGGVDDPGDDEDAPTPGEEIADQERSYWDDRRRIQELGDDASSRRERSRLRARQRKTHQRFRTHRETRRWDEGPVRSDLRLPPLPDPEDLDDDFTDDD